MFTIKFFKDNQGNEPIKMFLDALMKKAATSKTERIRLKKIVEYLSILEEHGVSAGMPYVKHIVDDIWELRPINDRVFFFRWQHRTFILLHHFVKKTRKTPPSEIAQAKRNKKEFLENYEERGYLNE
ncbi:MAG: type II toxin-antitoxin system RelE/ParE family toxin [Defluviitaleaceae bacterium]|nr:type II toxin-antitoxin system RelE/ParE family toxin [Defluviitaleaceae bacterium]MCL2273564.1 type II toxin-antitoxin system RelE/ParE family toxin [Defluviitaleaceae bacterium]